MSSCDMKRTYHRPLIPGLWVDGGLCMGGCCHSVIMNHGSQVNSMGWNLGKACRLVASVYAVAFSPSIQSNLGVRESDLYPSGALNRCALESDMT